MREEISKLLTPAGEKSRGSCGDKVDMVSTDQSAHGTVLYFLNKNEGLFFFWMIPVVISRIPRRRLVSDGGRGARMAPLAEQ